MAGFAKGSARGSATGRPLMVLLDLLGQRWTLRILWELGAEPLSFRELRLRCDQVSPSVLNARLKTLREARLVALTPAGYAPTERAAALAELIGGLDRLAGRWAAEDAAMQE